MREIDVFMEKDEVYLIIYVPNNEVSRAFLIKDESLIENRVFISVEEAYAFIYNFNIKQQASLSNYHVIPFRLSGAPYETV